MSDETYRVGYRRPPRHTQYKPGRSGNPRGKPKGRKNHKTELLEELSKPVVVTERGRRRTVSMQTLIIKRIVADAGNGDAKARELLLKLIGSIEPAEATLAEMAPTAAEDAEILGRFRERLIEEIKAQDKGSRRQAARR